MKSKKPSRIKGSVMHDPIGRDPFSAGYQISSLAKSGAVPHLVLPIDNPDALVEQVADCLSGSVSWPQALNDARAALRSIGVPIKRETKK